MEVQMELDKMASQLSVGPKCIKPSFDSEKLRLCFKKSIKMTPEQENKIDVDREAALFTFQALSLMKWD
jgi:hypothetical protein